MRYAIIVLIVFTIPVLAFPATIHVPGDQPTIQAGIDAAVNGDTVLVAPGTYVENIDFSGKAITVTSSGGAVVTVIDGNQAGSVVTFQNWEKADSVLDGFTVRNGKAKNGGGIYCLASSPVITNNTISGNTVNELGSGIYCYSSSPTITNNAITENTALGSGGGGIYCIYSSPTITNNTITGNAAKRGGGIACYHNSSPTITNNTISENSVSYYGGGIYCYESSPIIKNNVVTGNEASEGGGIGCVESSPVITSNTIKWNKTNYGAGIWCDSSSPTITNNIITENMANTHGGGINCNDYSYPVTTNNVITENMAFGDGGGIYCVDSFPAITNNTIKGNTAKHGGGIWCSGSYLSITNTILWDNSATTGREISGSPIVTYSDVKGGWTGTGNIDKDPLFVDEPNEDLHLTFTSPCRDTGDNSAVTEPADFEGDPRIAYGTVDMGADEFYTHLYWTGDATPGGSAALKFVGLPGTSVQFWLGSGVMDPPLPTKYGDWYLQFPLLASVGLGLIPSPEGVLVLPFTFPPNTPTPLSLPFQAGIGTELTNLCVLEIE